MVKFETATKTIGAMPERVNYALRVGKPLNGRVTIVLSQLLMDHLRWRFGDLAMCEFAINNGKLYVRLMRTESAQGWKLGKRNKAGQHAQLTCSLKETPLALDFLTHNNPCICHSLAEIEVSTDGSMIAVCTPVGS